MYRTHIHRPLTGAGWLLLATLALAGQSACAQATSAPPLAMAGTSASDAPLYSAEAIAELVAPVALYPDDLLAIVLPASTYPLQIVQAQRFLDALASNPSLEPDETWDDSVVALLNYPEVIELMNDDLDWTAELGQAVLAQQPEVIAAIEGFRRRAFTAGNLKSDDRQVVEVNDDAVYVRPADPKVIYVPYYDPAVVTVYSPRPAYYYYPRPYPVYYYPYPVGYTFASGFFWGVTSYFALGWNSHHVHVYHHDYHDHPYYGRPYLYDTRHYYYRRPPKVVNNYYYVDADHDRHDRNRYDRERDRHDHDRYDREPWSDRDGSKHDRYRDRTQRAETYWRPDHRRTGARPGMVPRRQPGDRQHRPSRPRGEELAGIPSDPPVQSPRSEGQASATPPPTIPHASPHGGPRAGAPQSARGGDGGRQPPLRGGLLNSQAERPARSHADDQQYRTPDRAPRGSGERSQRRTQPQPEGAGQRNDRQTRQTQEPRGSSTDKAREPQLGSAPERRTYRADTQRRTWEDRASREAVAGPRPAPRREFQERALARESGGARAFGSRPPPEDHAAVQPQARQQAQPRLDGNRFERREPAERGQPREPRSERGGRNGEHGRRAERGGRPGADQGRESR